MAAKKMFSFRIDVTWYFRAWYSTDGYWRYWVLLGPKQVNTGESGYFRREIGRYRVL